MSRLQITDNHHDGKSVRNCVVDDASIGSEELDTAKKDLEKIANIKIGELKLEDTPNLLVFPRDLHQHGDEISESHIISMKDDMISTGNIMGFVGVNDTQLDIKSRFAQKDGEDYFLHYMLQKVFAINLFDIKHTTNEQQIFDFLLYLFPYYLKKALAQGLFKKYRRFEHNDANICGPINISRHIRENIPFKGTVAYTTREHSYDNEITQLVRHTIEFIRTKQHGAGILNNDLETKECVSQIVMATQTYNARERQKVINQNLRPIRHPYYSEYTPLQKICLQILRHESLKYGHEKDKIYGILFDGAWLWEEYLSVILKDKYDHFLKKRGKRFYLFKDPNSQQIIPDYIANDKSVVADAKYIPLNKHNGYYEDSQRATAIYYKTITYMFRFNTKVGYLFYPHPNTSNKIELLIDGDSDGKLIKYGIGIPSGFKRFNEFVDEMVGSEGVFLSSVLPGPTI